MGGMIESLQIAIIATTEPRRRVHFRFHSGSPPLAT